MKIKLREKEVVTRTDSQCSGCLSVLPKGSRLLKGAYKQGNTVRSYCLCPVCKHIAFTYFRYQDDWDIGNLKQIHGKLFWQNIFDSELTDEEKEMYETK